MHIPLHLLVPFVQRWRKHVVKYSSAPSNRMWREGRNYVFSSLSRDTHSVLGVAFLPRLTRQRSSRRLVGTVMGYVRHHPYKNSFHLCSSTIKLNDPESSGRWKQIRKEGWRNIYIFSISSQISHRCQANYFHSVPQLVLNTCGVDANWRRQTAVPFKAVTIDEALLLGKRIHKK